MDERDERTADDGRQQRRADVLDARSPASRTTSSLTARRRRQPEWSVAGRGLRGSGRSPSAAASAPPPRPPMPSAMTNTSARRLHASSLTRRRMPGVVAHPSRRPSSGGVERGQQLGEDVGVLGRRRVVVVELDVHGRVRHGHDRRRRGGRGRWERWSCVVVVVGGGRRAWSATTSSCAAASWSGADVVGRLRSSRRCGHRRVDRRRAVAVAVAVASSSTATRRDDGDAAATAPPITSRDGAALGILGGRSPDAGRPAGGPWAPSESSASGAGSTARSARSGVRRHGHGRRRLRRPAAARGGTSAAATAPSWRMPADDRRCRRRPCRRRRRSSSTRRRRRSSSAGCRRPAQLGDQLVVAGDGDVVVVVAIVLAHWCAGLRRAGAGRRLVAAQRARVEVHPHALRRRARAAQLGDDLVAAAPRLGGVLVGRAARAAYVARSTWPASRRRSGSTLVEALVGGVHAHASRSASCRRGAARRPRCTGRSPRPTPRRCARSSTAGCGGAGGAAPSSRRRRRRTSSEQERSAGRDAGRRRRPTAPARRPPSKRWATGSISSSTSSSSWRGGSTFGGGGGGGGGLGIATSSVVAPCVSGSGVRERSGVTSTGTQPSSPASSSTQADDVVRP